MSAAVRAPAGAARRARPAMPALIARLCRLGMLAMAIVVAAAPCGGRGGLWAAEVFAPYRQMREDGVYLDWFEGYAAVTGRTISFRKLSEPLYLQQAKAVAEENGRVRLLSFLKLVPIDAMRHLGDDPALFARVKRMVDDTTAASVETGEGTALKAFMKVPLYGDGGLAGLVMPGPSAAGAAGPAAPTGAAPPPAGARTGLVLDASRVAGATASLLPRIVDEKGREVYGIDRADPSTARARGLAAFATRLEMKEAVREKDPRQGINPIRVAAAKASGDGLTEFVVTSADADAILAGEASGSFLRQCRVLILLPPPGPAAQAAPPAARAPQRPPAARPAKPKELEKPH